MLKNNQTATTVKIMLFIFVRKTTAVSKREQKKQNEIFHNSQFYLVVVP